LAIAWLCYSAVIVLGAVVLVIAVHVLLDAIRSPVFGASLGPVYRACAAAVPEHRALFLKAAQASGPGPIEPSPRVVAHMCRGLVPNALIETGTPESALVPERLEDVLQRSWPTSAENP
jgi:hypothetical protein